MSAGIFRGPMAKFVALGGCIIGVGMITLSFFTKRASIVQYLTLPLAILVGVILVIPDTGSGVNVTSLIAEAVRFGGVAQPPIPFDPGWRFILLVLTATLGAASMSLATGLNKPKLGIFMPVPLIMGAALLQPDEGFLLSGGVAGVLVIAGLGVSYGVELAREGATSGNFEFRRLLQGGGVLALVVALLAVLSQTGFLFPEKTKVQIIPPKRPEVQPAQEDRVLFTAESDRPGPWRLGVLDGYDGEWFLTPPIDTRTFAELRDGPVPEESRQPDADKVKVKITLRGIEGHVIPQLANMQRIKGLGAPVHYDPRTQSLRLIEQRAKPGQSYEIESAKPPDGRQLSEAGPPPEAIRKEFVQKNLPPVPAEVAAILNEAAENPWDRLQYIRSKFYETLTASGAGNPTATPPSRVVEMLQQKPGTPYEITAAEVLLARWAGIPARIGYGFYGGDTKKENPGVWEIHPKHGATFLEVYFGKYGWVPIVGVPPKAQSSFSKDEKNPDPQVRPTEELALIVYVPIRLQTIQLLYVVVRYWLGRTLPIILGLIIVWWGFPGIVKVVRRFRRRKWAGKGSVRERVAVAYGEFRDVAADLNVGDPSLTPLEFQQAIVKDDEHDEFSWLVTRALWGDLRRDLRLEDADDAERMGQSVTRRLRRAQSPITRLLGFGARASLRAPFTTEIPNLWPKWAVPGGIRRRIRSVFNAINPFASKRPSRRRVTFVGGVLIVALALLAGGCSRDIDYTKSPEIPLPALLVPNVELPVDGKRITFQREAIAESAFPKAGRVSLIMKDQYQVYSVRRNGRTDGSLQIAAFKYGIDAREPEVRQGVLRSIGTGRFKLTRIGEDRVYVQKLAEQTIYLWFHPNGRMYQLMVAVNGFEEADDTFVAVLAHQRGQDAVAVVTDTSTTKFVNFDPRRGAVV